MYGKSRQRKIDGKDNAFLSKSLSFTMLRNFTMLRKFIITDIAIVEISSRYEFLIFFFF